MPTRALSEIHEVIPFQIPHSKMPKKSMAVATKKHFGSPLKNNEMKTVMKGHVTLNTQKNTLWALNCFCEWMLTRNERAQRDGNENRCQENRSVQYNAGTTESLGRLFGDLTNCTIGSLTVNVRPIFNVQSAEKVDKEFDELVQHADFDY